ncbi:MAG: ATP-binding protein [Chloroflexi bacterium]|jgi:DNA replication protein DnaC|nr:ATP-binding protein [Chloroflexota bacterium]
MSDVSYARAQTHLARLKLPQMAECLEGLAQEAAKHDWTYLEFLDQLLDREVSARYERDVAMKTKLAHFPFVKTLEQFDFVFQPSINERQVRELATLSFIGNGENILLLGPPGVGKTHLAIGLGVAAIQQAISVYFTSIVDLLEQLHRDAKEDRLDHRLQTLCRPKLLILDEMGYFPLDRMAAQFLFQLVSRRYGRGSIILTSNKSYGEWGDIFADQVLAAAILDRLLHFSTTLNIRGQSYRLREKRKAGVFTEQVQPAREV